MGKKKLLIMFAFSVIFITSCHNESVHTADAPVFTNVIVHDPSVVKMNDTYYVFGSHLASAKSSDLMQWKQISLTAQSGNKLIPNVKEEMAEALEWAQNQYFWAPDVIRLNDGRYYMYYCNCKGDRPLSCLE